MLRTGYRRLVPGSVRTPLYEARARGRENLARAIVTVRDRRLLFWSHRLRRLRGAYAGRRCFVMGNGPSLNEMDLAPLGDELVWGLNRCYLLFDRIDWRPSFYVSQDSVGLIESAEEISRLVRDNPMMLCFLPSTYGKGRVIAPSGDNLHWVDSRRVDAMSVGAEGLGVDLLRLHRTGVATLYTVAATAIQLAAYLGFDPIYLIGCDNSYVVPVEDQVVHANDRVRALRAGERSDPNHFDHRYHATGDRWNLPPDGGHDRSFELVDSLCKQVGVQVLNATHGGRLEVFPRVDYQELVSGS